MDFSLGITFTNHLGDAKLRWSDYTRGRPTNQLDDGIGDTLVPCSVEQSTQRSARPIHTLEVGDTLVQ